ncbi:MAG: hypothetical protein F6K03_05360 [Kamptonema sp. SIO4C4]|nr:hypothetical protein [Kamptonema sp. SIO4C4]
MESFIYQPQTQPTPVVSEQCNLPRPPQTRQKQDRTLTLELLHRVA